MSPIPEWQSSIRQRCFHPSGEWAEFTRAEVDRSIPARFEAMVAAHDARLALKGGAHQLTYGQANRRINQMTHALLAVLGEGAEPVAILANQGVEPVLAMLAVLKAGKFYVPLDSTSAPERIGRMLHNAQARLILADEACLPVAQQLAQPGCGVLDLAALPDSLPAHDPDFTVAPDAIAAIVYTSGTTGEPKGIYTTHRNLLQSVRIYSNNVHLCRHDRLSLVRSISFNGAVKDIYGALLNGAALYPFDLARHGYGEMARWLQAEEITVYCSVATVFRQFVQSLHPAQRFSHLRLVAVGGEPVYRRDVHAWRPHAAPGCILHHSFGASEVGYATSLYADCHADDLERVLPAGFACEDREILILDEGGQPCQAGETGEIAVRGPFMALGYWRQPELIQAAFFADPTDDVQRIYRTGDLGRLRLDGCLEHHGRRDLQAKVWGQRVELGEVEAALLALRPVQAAAVAVCQGAGGQPCLVAYVVAQPMPGLAGRLRQQLAHRLPSYMIPSHFELLPALPKTAMGKTDRGNLPAPTFARPSLDTAYEAPRAPLEKQLVAIWEEVLGVLCIGVHDAFFDLGGNSLLAMQILQRANRQLRVDLTPAQLFDLSTVEKMAAAVLEQWLAEPAAQATTARWLDELLASP